MRITSPNIVKNKTDKSFMELNDDIIQSIVIQANGKREKIVQAMQFPFAVNMDSEQISKVGMKPSQLFIRKGFLRKEWDEKSYVVNFIAKAMECGVEISTYEGLLQVVEYFRQIEKEIIELTSSSWYSSSEYYVRAISESYLPGMNIKEAVKELKLKKIKDEVEKILSENPRLAERYTNDKIFFLYKLLKGQINNYYGLRNEFEEEFGHLKVFELKKIFKF